jgi:adenylate cyclase
VVDNYGASYHAAELYRWQGELLLAQTSTPPAWQAAEASLQQALTLARQQHAKSLELRAAISLGRLWCRQGKHDQTRHLLTAVYGWFTEGFDTADLQEAQALLEALA